MSDQRVTPETLARGRSQPPVASYFDPAVLERERALLFARAPRYAGHSLAVPEVGDFHALPQENEGRALVHGPNGIELLSNVCRHRQAIMLRGRGHTGPNIVCPLHRWTYGLDGTLIGAPHFPEDPCRNLERKSLDAWHGLLFEAAPEGARRVSEELVGLGHAGEFDFAGFVLDKVEVHECAYNWKTFIEVYLEDYHVGPFHPGLGQFVTCEDLRWELGRHHSVQTVGPNSRLAKPGSDVYKRWHDAVLAYRQDRHDDPVPPHGAIWLTLYPTVMVEWYPHVLVVSTLHPLGPQRTRNVVEFYYPEEIASFEREFVEAEQAAYRETAVEDDEIALRMDAGRKALLDRGEDDAGPYQSPMEDGMQHFHEWYQREMKDACTPPG